MSSSNDSYNSISTENAQEATGDFVLTPNAGHPRGPITIVPHNVQWTTTYTTELQKALAALKSAGFSSQIKATEHIGSTSISGLGAKPIVDIMIGVGSDTDLTNFPTQALAALNYHYRPFLPLHHSGPPYTRLLFSKFAKPAVNIHVFVYQGSRWNGHLAVRNYLRAHPRAATSYEHIKRAYADRYKNNLPAYGKAKRPFLDSLERLAIGHHLANTEGSVIAHRRNTISAGSTPPLSFGDPAGWQTGTWYVEQPGGGWAVSPDQNPRQDGASGIFVRYTGTSSGAPHWEEYGAGGDSVVDAGSEPIPDDEPPVLEYTTTMYRNDGSSYTIMVVTPGYTNFVIPSNADIIFDDNGVLLVRFNNDGSPWTDPGSGDTGGDTSGDAGSYDNPYEP